MIERPIRQPGSDQGFEAAEASSSWCDFDLTASFIDQLPESIHIEGLGCSFEYL